MTGSGARQAPKMGTQIIGKFSLICRYNRVATVFDVAGQAVIKAKAQKADVQDSRPGKGGAR